MKSLNYIFLLCLAACNTSSEHRHGVQEHYHGYIPARIAVLPCLPWPDTLRSSQRGLISAPQKDIAKLCHELNKYVLKGFESQPYLKGYTPQVVQKLLTKSKKPRHLDLLEEVWHYKNKEKIIQTSSFLQLYNDDISLRAPWIEWLETFSKSTRHADTILLPMIASLDESEEEQRGILSFKKKSEILLWLIDTNNGKLIWSGSRKSAIIRYAKKDETSPEKPTWEQLHTRLLVKTLWKDFPGRFIN
ncbi:MAG: hypothetical protein AB8C84_06290 [Oligoflexales bacterium]